MKEIHLILTGLSLTIILLSINRLTNLTLSYIQPYEFLRWLDFNAMIPIPLISIVLYYLLVREVSKDNSFIKSRFYGFLFIVFVSGVYLFGASSGDHEVTNYLNTRFCDRGKIESPICNIIRFNDDEFSHLVYYAGFILLNVALIFMQYNMPYKAVMMKKDVFLVSANGIFIGLGIFANLAFEEIGLDLWFFGSLMVLSLFLLFLQRKMIWRFPVIYYFAVSYTLGVVGTFFYKLVAS